MTCRRMFENAYELSNSGQSGPKRDSSLSLGFILGCVGVRMIEGIEDFSDVKQVPEASASRKV